MCYSWGEGQEKVENSLKILYSEAIIISYGYSARKIARGLKPTTFLLWTSRSLLYDRKFLIMQGRSPLTQKAFPTLCLLKPEIDLDRKLMTLRFEDLPPVQVPIRDESDEPGSGETYSVCIGKVCGDSVQGIDCGPQVSEWWEDIRHIFLVRSRIVDFAHCRF